MYVHVLDVSSFGVGVGFVSVCWCVLNVCLMCVHWMCVCVECVFGIVSTGMGVGVLVCITVLYVCYICVCWCAYVWILDV